MTDAFAHRPVTDAFAHGPVMVDEIVELFAPVPAGTILDGTVGGGGHAAALLGRLDHISVLGLDRDRDAVAAAGERLAPFAARALVRQARFDALGDVAAQLGHLPLSGVLLDLGVSSPQLDWADRGFSHRNPAPLDMRMDQTQTLSAAIVVNSYAEARLAALLRDNADERFAHRIARAIVARRPIQSTDELAELVRDAIPAATRRQVKSHPAARTFQAIRIEVNDELRVLEQTLPRAIDALAPGGRVVVLAYHSGEDRIVKAAFRQAETGGCTCPARLGCVCGAIRLVKPLFRGSHTPSAAELAANPRSASARLRAVERLPEGLAA